MFIIKKLHVVIIINSKFKPQHSSKDWVERRMQKWSSNQICYKNYFESMIMLNFLGVHMWNNILTFICILFLLKKIVSTIFLIHF